METDNRDSDWFWELSAICSSEWFELISCYLFEMNASGIEEVSEGSGKTAIRVFFPADISSPVDVMRQIGQHAEGLKPEDIDVTAVEKKPIQNWQENWRSHFQPVEIGLGFLVRPPWETVDTDRKEIVIHPGQGFGTGYHESTHLALLLMEFAYGEQPIRTVADIGTGSGILTIAALLSGSDHVIAIDLDREALREVPVNLQRSGLQSSAVTLVQCGPQALKPVAEMVVANIEGHLLEEMAADLDRLTSAGGFLLLSGMLHEKEKRVFSCFLPRYEIIQQRVLTEWSGVLLRKI